LRSRAARYLWVLGKVVRLRLWLERPLRRIERRIIEKIAEAEGSRPERGLL